jgi:flagellar motor switch protein FliN/FliY
MTTNQLAGKTHRAFSSAFFNALVAAITDSSGSPWLVAAVPDAEATPDDSEPVRAKLTLDGSVQGEFLLEFRRKDAIVLASKCLRQSADEFETEQSDALLKVIRAGVDKFCSALAQEYGTFTINASLASEPASDRANIAEITAADDDGNRVSIRMYLDPALTEALTLHSETASVDEVSGKSIDAAAAKEGEAIPEQVNLKLVLDVELNVTLRFGQRQLALREVLELTSGSVIELDRQVEEPVELLLEGQVIARGEAVVIDGNYGLRVTEVPQPLPPSVLR